MSSVLKTLSLSLLALPLIACGGGKDKDPVLVDAPGGGSADAPAASCTLASSLTPGAGAQLFKQTDDPAGTATDHYVILGAFNQDTAPDLLEIDLYKGFTKFMPTFPPAGVTVPLTGDETNFKTCGACVFGLGDATDAGADTYFASGGTLTLTSITDTSLAGSISGLTLAHVMIDDQNETTVIADGCTSTVSTFTFSGAPTDPPAGFTDSGKRRFRLKLDRQ